MKTTDSFILFDGGIYKKKNLSMTEKNQQNNVIDRLNLCFKNMNQPNLRLVDDNVEYFDIMAIIKPIIRYKVLGTKYAESYASQYSSSLIFCDTIICKCPEHEDETCA